MRALGVTGGRCHQVSRLSQGEPRRPGRKVRCSAATAAPAVSFVSSACSLPHPEKVATGGEDAYFISHDGTALGVADGVGSWRESGVDPGEYARSFMRTACEFLDGGALTGLSSDAKEWEDVARKSLGVAHQKTRVPGSSTACVLVLNPQERKISAANLGDSGFAVIRNGTAVFQTPPLMHSFDCPLQFGACPEHVERTDYSSDAITYTLNVMPGDVIVMASDGLWDNCYIDEVLQLVPDTDDAVENAAEGLASAAREHAEDEEFDSPHIEVAKKAGYDLKWWQKVVYGRFEDGRFQPAKLTGGKLDDITVLVARVTDGAAPPPPPAPASSNPDDEKDEQAA